MKFSPQESKILAFLSTKNEVYWQELAQFCKEPASVKLKTVKKVVSDLKKKFKDSNATLPFNCSFKDMSKYEAVASTSGTVVATDRTTEFKGQKLVQIKRNSAPNNQVTTIPKTTIIDVVPAKTLPDFSIIHNVRQIRTRSGNYNLNYDEFDLFAYLFANRGRFISLEELKDKVCFPKFGSKLPARWFSAIQRRIGNIRHQIPETRDKLLTAKQQSYTGYIFN